MSDPAEYPESPDLALLSAYLDDVLPAPERAIVDRRLGSEPNLRTELAALRQTQTILRAAPILTIPRDFTLDPARYRRSSQLRVVQRRSGRTLRIIGMLGTMIAVAAALILVVLNVNFGNSAPSAATILIASNPTAVPSPARKVDESPGTAVPTMYQTPAPSPTPVIISTSIPVIVATSIPATALPATPAAAAAAQSGALSNGQASGGNANQDNIAGSPQPNLSAPVLPSNGAAPNAPQIAMASSATPHSALIAPIAAPTGKPSEQPGASRTISFDADLPTVLKIILWVFLGLFGGKGLNLR